MHVLIWSYQPFLDALFPSSCPYRFSDMCVPHYYKIANTPILQSRNTTPPPFVVSQLCIDVAISSNFIFSVPHNPPLFYYFSNMLHNIIPSPFLCFWIANLFITPSTADLHFLWCQRSKAPLRNHFVCRPCVCLSVRLSVCPSVCHTFGLLITFLP